MLRVATHGGWINRRLIRHGDLWDVDCDRFCDGIFRGRANTCEQLVEAWLPIHWAHQDLAQRRIRSYAEDIILI